MKEMKNCLKPLLGLLCLFTSSLLSQTPLITDRLIAYYPFDGDGLDYGSNAYHGQNQEAQPTTDRNGNIDSALSFDGVNDSVIIEEIDFGNPINELSVAMWMKVDSTAAGYADHIISKDGGAEIEDYTFVYYLFGNASGPNNGAIFPYGSINGEWLGFIEEGTQPNEFYYPPIGEWHHYAFTYDGQKGSYFVDGILESERSAPGTMTINNGPLRIGGGWALEYFDGSLDEIYFFSKALNETEISLLSLFSPIIDTDGDGIIDSDEVSIYGTNPQLADTDNDQLSDGFEIGINRYELIETSLNWNDAKIDAESKGGHLATIINEEEWNFVIYSLGNILQGKNFWLGGSDGIEEGNWQWITGERWNYEKWSKRTGNGGKDQPDNGNETQQQNYLLINEFYGLDWDDAEMSVSNRTGIEPFYLLEIGYFTDPLNADTDGDGFSDGDEWLNLGTVPTVFDDPPLISIVQDIPDKQAVLGTTVTFQIEVEGENLSYQWYFNGDAMNRETNPILTLPSIRFSDEGEYFVEISNGNQTIQSRAAYLSVVEFRLDVYAAVELEWQTQAGLTYQLQSSIDLMNWEDLEDPFVGTGETVAKLLSTRHSGARYFRLERRE